MVNSTRSIFIKLHKRADELLVATAAAVGEGNMEVGARLLEQENEARALAQRALLECQREARVAAITN